MILVADSGSTKTSWIVGDANRRQTYQCGGLSPYFVNENEIATAVRLLEIPKENTPTQIFFYGTGCSSDGKKNIVALGIKQVFPLAAIHIEHDILASAIATCQTEPGIACILGTGTNTCYYDGNTIQKNVPSLGYILSDEGSGNYFGKLLCRDFFYEIMPADLRLLFYEKYAIEKTEFLDYIYHKPSPNAYLASFSGFMSEHREHTYIQTILQSGFSYFFEMLITKYENHQRLPIHFIGSIAYNFKVELEKVAHSYSCKIGVVLQHPIDELFSYHLPKI